MTADYNRSVEESVNLLQLCDIQQAPIDLNVILYSLQRTIRICSYTRFSSQSYMSIDEICDYFESDFGACIYFRDTEQYIIYYNDTKNNRKLDRFTIAHELGHIFLEHYQDEETNMLLRSNIPEDTYRKYENEANCFARNLLSPIPLVDRVTDVTYYRSTTEILEAFDITYSAAVTRRDLYLADSYRMTPSYYDYFNSYNILYGFFCITCHSGEITKEGFCKICGEVVFRVNKSCHTIFYDGVDLDINKRVIQCPECTNEVFSLNAHYCKICGTSLLNVCTGNAIEDFFGNILDYEYHINDGNARYCIDCGSKTTFFNKGYLKAWQNC